jgi:hypothetical protein
MGIATATEFSSDVLSIQTIYSGDNWVMLKAVFRLGRTLLSTISSTVVNGTLLFATAIISLSSFSMLEIAEVVVDNASAFIPSSICLALLAYTSALWYSAIFIIVVVFVLASVVLVSVSVRLPIQLLAVLRK